MYYRELLTDNIYNLFKDTYWANHQISNARTEDKIKILVKNREEIANRYKLKKRLCYSKIAKKYLNKICIIDDKEKERRIVNNYGRRYEYEYLFNYGNFMMYRDHTEYYLTENGDIVSIFSEHCSLDELKFIENNDYIEIEPIYNEDQKTFIKVIKKFV